MNASTTSIMCNGANFSSNCHPSSAAGDIDVVEDEDPSREVLPGGFMTVIQIFYALVCIVGLCGNTLVIYVVLRYSKMQTVTNMYILNLAIADECFLVGIPFLIATMVKENWIFGNVMCKMYMTTTSINQFTSSIFLTVMSADRYIAVCHPISSPKYRTNVIARVVSLTAWATSALLMVPVFMYAASVTKQGGGQNCNIFWPFDRDENDTLNLNSTEMINFEEEGVVEDGDDFYNGTTNRLPPVPPATSTFSHVLNGQTAFTFYSFVLGFAIPLILILIFYILVIVKLKTVGPKNKSKEKKKSHRKVTRLVLTVITVYILCWLPYWITQLALIFTPPGHNQDTVMVAVMLLAGCLSYSNSAMNPVLYAFLSDNFKKSFMKACTCAKGRDANAALHVENSAFPRRRTLGASGHNNRKGNHPDQGNRHHDGKGDDHHHNHQHKGRLAVHHHHGGGVSAATTTGDDHGSHEMNDVSTGVTTMTTSRASRSTYECHTEQSVGQQTHFNSTTSTTEPQMV